MVGVDIARDDRGHADVPGEVAQQRVPACIAALEGPLELDVEALAECACELDGGVRVVDAETRACAAGEADEALVQLGQQPRVERRGERLGALLRPCVRMRCCEQSAEVRVAAGGLHEQRDVVSTAPPRSSAGRAGTSAPGRLRRAYAAKRHLCARDRPDAEVLRGGCELERAVDAFVVGERERVVAELRRAQRELLGVRGAVEEGERRVAVELDVAHRLSHIRHELGTQTARARC